MSSTIFAINFSFITARVERKVCVWNCLIFSSNCKLFRFSWNLSCFVPNVVGILTHSFSRKLFLKLFFRNFLHTKAILFRFVNFFEKIHTSFFICCLYPVRDKRPKKKTQKRIKGRKAKTFSLLEKIVL